MEVPYPAHRRNHMGRCSEVAGLLAILQRVHVHEADAEKSERATTLIPSGFGEQLRNALNERRRLKRKGFAVEVPQAQPRKR
jgi:hypothetical protein